MNIIAKILMKLGITRNNQNLLEEHITYDYIVNLMKEKGFYSKLEFDLNSIEKIQNLFKIEEGAHSINHTIRVIFNSYAIGLLENIDENTLKIVAKAAMLHDIGRETNGEDSKHGVEGAKIARKLLEKEGEFSKEDIDLICFIIEEHCLSSNQNKEDLSRLSEEQRKKYEYCLSIVKDADKLDRVRLGDLDVTRLANDNSRKLVGMAKTELEKKELTFTPKRNFYSFTNEDVQKMFDTIQESSPDANFQINDISENFMQLKVVEEKGFLSLLDTYKNVKSEISIKDFIDILTTLNKKDLEIIENRYQVEGNLFVESIVKLGLQKFCAEREKGKLDKWFGFDNFGNTIINFSKEKKEDLIKIGQMDLYDEYKKYFGILSITYDKMDKNQIEFAKELLYSRIESYKKLSKEESTVFIKNAVPLPMFIAPMIARKEDTTQEINKINSITDIPKDAIALAYVTLSGLPEKNFEEKCRVIQHFYKLKLFTKDSLKKQDILVEFLVNLPDELTDDEIRIIKDSISGNLEDLNITNISEIRNLKESGNTKLYSLVRNCDDLKEAKKKIIKTKLHQSEKFQTNMYFYLKYFKDDKSEKDDYFELFYKLYLAEDIENVISICEEIDEKCKGFEWDEMTTGIENRLEKYAKKDIVQNSKKMLSTIENEQNEGIIDITGKEYELLISVIAGYGSPFLVHYLNGLASQYNNEKESKNPIIKSLAATKYLVRKKLGVKRKIKQRYTVDISKYRQRCLSSINQNYLGHIYGARLNKEDSYSDDLLFVYFPQEENNISYMGNADLYTEYDKPRDNPERKRVVHKDTQKNISYLRQEDLIGNIKSANNEVVADASPQAILCLDRVSNIARRLNKQHKIPIIYIDLDKQFEIIKANVEEYYNQAQEMFQNSSSNSQELIEQFLNPYEGNKNIIRRAFQLGKGYSFMDKEYRFSKQTSEIFEKLSFLLNDIFSKSNTNDQELIRQMIERELSDENTNYCTFLNFVDVSGVFKSIDKCNEAEIDKNR